MQGCISVPGKTRTSVRARSDVTHELDSVGGGVVIGTVPHPRRVVAAGVDGESGVAEGVLPVAGCHAHDIRFDRSRATCRPDGTMQRSLECLGGAKATIRTKTRTSAS